MGSGLRSVLRGLNSVRLNGYAYIWANLAFVALSLPVITLPAAYRALFRMGHHAQTEPSEADLALFWETFRQDFWKSLLWGLAHVLYGLITVSNLSTYEAVEGTGVTLLRFIWLGGAFVWLGALTYTWPIYYEMEQPSLLSATRNAVIMTLRNPFFTLMVLLSILLLALISTVLVATWILLTFGAISAVANAAVLDRLALYRTVQEVSS